MNELENRMVCDNEDKHNFDDDKYDKEMQALAEKEDKAREDYE